MKNKVIFLIVFVFGLMSMTSLALNTQKNAVNKSNNAVNTKVKKETENAAETKTKTKTKAKTKTTDTATKTTDAAADTKETLQDRVNRLEQQLAKFTQNRDNPKALPEWFKKIGISGLINVDLKNRTKPDFSGEASNYFAIGPTKLNVDAKVSDWFKGHIGLFYASRSDYYYPASEGSSSSGIQVDEVYIDAGNFAKTPFYLRAGQQYLPFGNYHRYPIEKPLTQLLSETRAVAAQLGFVDTSGLYGSLFGFNGLSKSTSPNRVKINDYGAALGYVNLNHKVGFDLGAGYLNNMADVGAIDHNIASGKYVKRVGALSLHGDVMTGPFDFGARYVTALNRFSPTDFSYRKNGATTRGAKPHAASVKAGYAFSVLDHKSKVNVGYQWSYESYNVSSSSTDPLRLPRNRIAVSCGVYITEHVIAALELTRDHDYSSDNGGTGKYDNTATLRLTALI